MTTQQRRSFFQAVGKLYSAATFRAQQARASLSLAAVIFTALLCLSCTSLTPERVNVLSAIAAQAAQLGAQEWLAKHPEHRESFLLVIAAFQNALRTGDTNPVAFLKSLPVSSLAGPAGELYVTDGRSSNDVQKATLVVWDSELNKSVRAEGALEKPVAMATLAGLKRGVAQMPPKFPPELDRVRRGHVPPIAVAITNDPAPLTDAQLDAQFEAIKAQLEARTNTVSTVDVQPTPSGASVVTVRWQGKPGVYCVQQRDDGSVEWLTFSHVTNGASYSTSWHPALPLGHWRVVRRK